MFPVRPLRSTGITPLPHYYGPVRLPRDSSQPPRRTSQLLTPAASPSVLGFATFGRLAALTRCSEAELRSLALRLIPSPTQGFAKPDYSDPHLSGYMSNRLFTWWTPPCMCITRTQASPQSTGQKLALIRNPSISPLSLLVHYCISAVLLPVCASHSDRPLRPCARMLLLFLVIHYRLLLNAFARFTGSVVPASTRYDKEQ